AADFDPLKPFSWKPREAATNTVNPVVRQTAIEALAAWYGHPKDPHLTSIAGWERSQNAVLAVRVWCRIPGDEARQRIRGLIGSGDDAVSVAAIHAAGLWRDRDAVPQLIGILKERSPLVRRAAAEALGRIGDDRGTGAMLNS